MASVPLIRKSRAVYAKRTKIDTSANMIFSMKIGHVFIVARCPEV